MRNFALLALAAVIAGSACAQGTTNTRTSTYTFPLVGLAASSEGIEVNLINLASNLSNGTAASCTGSVKFTTVSTGTVLAGGGTFTLASDAATSLAPTLGHGVQPDTDSRRPLPHHHAWRSLLSSLDLDDFR